MRMKIWILSVFNMALLTTATLYAQSTPESARISSVQVSGRGCEHTSAAVSISPDFKDLSVLFDNYVVEIGQGSQNPNLPRLQKDCLMQIQIEVPSGWQIALRSVDYRGFAAIPASAWAFHRFSQLIQNQPVASLREATIRGPSNANYQVHTEQRPERLAYSACSQRSVNLTLLSQLGVAYFPKFTDRSIAQITLDTADLSIQQDLGVEWRRCSVQPNLPTTGPIHPGPRPPRF